MWKMAKSHVGGASFTVTADCECRQPVNAARRRQRGLRCDVRFVESWLEYGTMLAARALLFPHPKAPRISLTRFGLRYILVHQTNNGVRTGERMAFKLS
jgi:hypothetical protein